MSHRGVRGVLGVVVVLIMAGLYNMQVEATSNATLEALTQYMDRRAANVRALTTKVEDLWTLRCGRDVRECKTKSYSACGSKLGVPASQLTCQPDETFTTEPPACCAGSGTLVSLQHSVVKAPTAVDAPDEGMTEAQRESVCAFTDLDKAFLENWDDFGDHMQYFGSVTGTFRNFPGVLWGIDWRTVTQKPGSKPCWNYDPRHRPWYVAAASGPKNVILILDTSPSMAKYDGLPVAKQAAARVLSTLLSTDWFNIVTFGIGSSPPQVYRDGTLVSGTLTDIADASNYMGDLPARGTADVPAAFDKAFELLRAGRLLNSTATVGTPCVSTIIFLTDGTDHQSNVDAIVNHVTAANADVKAHILTYAMGSGGDGHALSKKLACANQGLWRNFEESQDVSDVMADYYQFLAAATVRKEPIFTEPYPDPTYANLMVTTGAQAAYSYATTPPTLLGVVGIDILLVELDEQFTREAVQNLLADLSSKCPKTNLTECEMEWYRNRTIGETCGNSCPSHQADGVEQCKLPFTGEALASGLGDFDPQSAAINSCCCHGESPSDLSPLAIGLLIGAGILVVVLCITLGLCCARKRMAGKAQEAKRELFDNPLTAAGLSPKHRRRAAYLDGVVKKTKFAAGGSGNVYVGTYGGSQVALKQLFSSMIAEELDDVFHEAAMLVKLDHPRVLRYYGLWADEQGVYIVTELCTGGSLSGQLFDSSNTVSWRTRMKYAIQAALGLSYLHSHNVVHGDIKPDNMLLNAQNDLVVADLGLARAVSSSSTDLSSSLGTAGYAAPEACQGKRVKQPDRADVFSFGIMLWSILTEQRPFDDGESRNRDISRKIISGERPVIPDSCPPGFKALLQDCWYKQPSKRPSMTQVHQRLVALQSEFYQVAGAGAGAES